MSTSRQLVDAVESAADDCLRKFGFTRQCAVHVIEVAPDVLGWVGLNLAEERDDDQLLVNPVLGVRHQTVEREVARLAGRKFHPCLPPTISAPLSQLSKHSGDYLFKEGRERRLDRQVSKMVDVIAAQAFSFFDAHSSLEALVGALRSGKYGFPHQVVYRLPVTLTLLGRHAEAQDEIWDSLADLGKRNDPAAKNFRAFADAFSGSPEAGATR